MRSPYPAHFVQGFHAGEYLVPEAVGGGVAVIPWFELPRATWMGVPIDAGSLLGMAGVGSTLLCMRQLARGGDLPVRRSLDGTLVVLACSAFFAHFVDILLYHREELQLGPFVLLPVTGGFCSLGALIGAALGVELGFRERGFRLRWREIDLLALSLLAGLCLVRLGCFVDHHHPGCPSSWLLAVAYPQGSRHDLALDELLLCVVLLSLVILVRRRVTTPPGWLAAMVIVGYAAGRLLIEQQGARDLESLGGVSDARWWGMTAVQWACLSAGTLFGVRLVLLSRRVKPLPGIGDPIPPR